jgi:hypothetical protein
MSVFLSVTDESAGKDRLDRFVFAGCVAREHDWSEIFTPAWQRLVLDGPHKLPYIHMTDIRSRKWREQNGLSESDAEFRVDQAIAAIIASDFIFPIGLTLSGADIVDLFADIKVKSSENKSSPFEPDYLCFLGYAMLALEYVAIEYPAECEKLDFVVEQNGKITKYIKSFHADLRSSFSALGRPDLARLVGDLRHVGKESIPAQVADVICWHTARSRNPAALDADSYRRYESLSRKKGHLDTFNRTDVEKFAKHLRSKGI